MCLVPMRQETGRVGRYRRLDGWIHTFALLRHFCGSRACTWVHKRDEE
jgi:hypothetical protein